MKHHQPSDESRARAIKRLVDLGLGDRILIAHDICRPEHLKSRGGWGYAHILQRFMGLLAEVGVPANVAQTFVSDNPVRWLIARG